MKFVVCGCPFQYTTSPFMKPLPVNVSRKEPLPAAALNGARLPIEALMLKPIEVEVPPLGFITVIGNVPMFSRSVASNLAVNCELLTKVVARSEPLK